MPRILTRAVLMVLFMYVSTTIISSFSYLPILIAACIFVIWRSISNGQKGIRKIKEVTK